MAREETLACPSCGAPYRTLIPAGAVQVKCTYCGAKVLVPPRLEGAVQRCPNHPEILAAGICNDCGESFCDRCLYTYAVRDGTLYVCEKCYEGRRSMQSAGAAVGLIVGIMLLVLFFGLMAKASTTTSSPPIPLLLPAFLLIGGSLYFLTRAKAKPTSIHDARATN